MSESLSLSFAGRSLHAIIAIPLSSLSLSVSRLETARTCGKWLIRFYFPQRRLSLAMVLVMAVTSNGYAQKMQALALDSSGTRGNSLPLSPHHGDYHAFLACTFAREHAAVCNAKPCSLFLSFSSLSICVWFFLCRTELREMNFTSHFLNRC